MLSDSSVQNTQHQHQHQHHIREIHYRCVREEWDIMANYLKDKSISLETELSPIEIRGIEATLRRLMSSPPSPQLLLLIQYLAFVGFHPAINITPYLIVAIDYSLTIELDTSSLFREIFANNLSSLLLFALRKVFFTFSSSFVEFSLLYLKRSTSLNVIEIFSTLLKECDSSSIEMFIKLLLNFNHNLDEIIEVVISLHDTLSASCTSSSTSTGTSTSTSTTKIPYPLKSCKAFCQLIDKYDSFPSNDQWIWFKDIIKLKMNRSFEVMGESFPYGSVYLSKHINLPTSCIIDKMPFEKEAFTFLWEEGFFEDAFKMLKKIKQEHLSFFRSFLSSLKEREFSIILQAPLTIEHLPNSSSIMEMFEKSINNETPIASIEMGITFFTRIMVIEKFSLRKAKILANLIKFSISHCPLALKKYITSSTSIFSPTHSPWILDNQAELPIYLALTINASFPLRYCSSSPSSSSSGSNDYLLLLAIYQICSYKCHLAFGDDDLFLVMFLEKDSLLDAIHHLRDIILQLPSYRRCFIFSFFKKTLKDSLCSPFHHNVLTLFLQNILLLYDNSLIIGDDLPDLKSFLGMINHLLPDSSSIDFIFTLGKLVIHGGGGGDDDDLLPLYDSILEKLYLCSNNFDIIGKYSFLTDELSNFTIIKVTHLLLRDGGGHSKNAKFSNNLLLALLNVVCEKDFKKYLLDCLDFYLMEMISDPQYIFLSMLLDQFLQRRYPSYNILLKFLKILDKDYREDVSNGGDHFIDDDDNFDDDFIYYQDEFQESSSASNHHPFKEIIVSRRVNFSSETHLTKNDLLLKIAIAHDSNFISKEPWLPRYGRSDDGDGDDSGEDHIL